MMNMINILNELKSCPFCGGNNNDIKEGSKIWLGTKWSDPISYSIYHWCETSVGEISNFIQIKAKTIEKMIEIWNTRY